MQNERYTLFLKEFLTFVCFSRYAFIKIKLASLDAFLSASFVTF